MPKVTLPRSSVAVRPVGTPYDTRRVSVDETAGVEARAARGFGAAISQVGGALQGQAERQFAVEEKARREARDLLEQKAGLELQREISLHSYGGKGADGLEVEGFLNRQGELGINFEDKVEAIRKARERIASSLPDDDARRGFELRAEQYSMQAVERFQRHASDNTRRVRRSTADGQMALAEQAVERNPGDVAAIAREVEQVRAGPVDPVTGEQKPGPLTMAMQAEGRTPAEIEAFTREWEAKMYAKAVEGVLRSDAPDAGARALHMLGAFREELGARGDPLRQMAEKVYFDQEGARVASGSIVLNKLGRIDENATRKALAAAAKEDLLPYAQKHVEAAIKNAKQAEKAEDDDLFSGLYSKWFETKDITTLPAAELERLRIYAPEKYRILDDLVAKEQRAEEARKRGTKAASTGEEERALAAFTVDIGENPEKYIAMSEADVRSVVASLPASKMQDAATKLEAVRQGAKKKVQFSAPEVQAILDVGLEHGWWKTTRRTSKSWKDDDAREFNAAVTSLEEWARVRRNNNETVSVDDLRAEAARLMIRPDTDKNRTAFGIPIPFTREPGRAPLEDVLEGRAAPAAAQSVRSGESFNLDDTSAVHRFRNGETRPEAEVRAFVRAFKAEHGRAPRESEVLAGMGDE